MVHMSSGCDYYPTPTRLFHSIHFAIMISEIVFVYFSVVGRNRQKYTIGEGEIWLGQIKHWSKNHRCFSMGDKMIPVIIPDPQKAQIDKNWCTYGRSKNRVPHVQELKKEYSRGWQRGGATEVNICHSLRTSAL